MSFLSETSEDEDNEEMITEDERKCYVSCRSITFPPERLKHRNHYKPYRFHIILTEYYIPLKFVTLSMSNIFEGFSKHMLFVFTQNAKSWVIFGINNERPGWDTWNISVVKNGYILLSEGIFLFVTDLSSGKEGKETISS